MPVSVTHEVSRDDGGIINLGRLGTLGSQMTSPNGKAFCYRIRTVDPNNIIPLGFSWFAYPSMGPDYSLFMLNMTWTTDYAGQANHVGIYCPTDNLSWFFTKNTGVNFNDGQYHDHVLTWVGFSGNKPTQLDYYIDGVLTGGTWTDLSDGAISGTANFGADVYMGCTRKSTGGTMTDFCSFHLSDYRIYDRGLTAREVREINLLDGRDNVLRGLHSRHPFRTTPINVGYHGVAAILMNDNGITPTFNNDNGVIQGVHKKVL